MGSMSVRVREATCHARPLYEIDGRDTKVVQVVRVPT